jgi:hypothetical protein
VDRCTKDGSLYRRKEIINILLPNILMIFALLSCEVFEDTLVFLFSDVVISALARDEADLTFSHGRERVLD